MIHQLVVKEYKHQLMINQMMIIVVVKHNSKEIEKKQISAFNTRKKIYLHNAKKQKIK
jgi:hypothetical protein